MPLSHLGTRLKIFVAAEIGLLAQQQDMAAAFQSLVKTS
jgi:hypothetical protein